MNYGEHPCMWERGFFMWIQCTSCVSSTKLPMTCRIPRIPAKLYRSRSEWSKWALIAIQWLGINGIRRIRDPIENTAGICIEKDAVDADQSKVYYSGSCDKVNTCDC